MSNFIDIFLFLLFGFVSGIITGITPGLHINTVAMLASKFAIPSLLFIIFLISMSITHSILDFLPSILFAAPNSETFFAVLPGHKLLLKGKGLYAIKLTVFASFIGVILALLFAPIFSRFALLITNSLKFAIPYILIFVIAITILSDRFKLKALFVAFLAALLGIVSLRYSTTGNALFALASGFFGAAMLLYSLKQKAKLPPQKITQDKFNIYSLLKNSLFGLFAGSAVALLPSIGLSQAVWVIATLIANVSNEAILIMLGSASSSSMVLSLFMLNATNKARTATASLIKETNTNFLEFILPVSLVAASLALIVASLLSTKIIKFMRQIPYSYFNIAILLLLFFAVALLSGVKGIIMFCSSTAIGFLANIWHVKRVNCMTFLSIPTILIYFGIN